jgi:hypothetical protein
MYFFLYNMYFKHILNFRWRTACHSWAPAFTLWILMGSVLLILFTFCVMLYFFLGVLCVYAVSNVASVSGLSIT